jgi:hypothetical protein
MRAHIIKDGKVVNTIEVESLNFMPDLIDADHHGGSIGDEWDGQKLTKPTPVVVIPQEVTRRQAKEALRRAGKLSAVQPAIDAIADADQRAAMQIEWDDSQTFQRTRPSLIAIGTAIGLDSAAIDALFVTAATL